MAPTTTTAGQRRVLLTRRIRILVATAIGYNIAEAVVGLTAGAAAGSPALIGFGLDSVVEVSSAVAVAWQFSATDPQTREKAALRLIALCFFALAVYVGVDSVLSLVGLGEPRPSPVGIGLAAVSLVVMPTLSLLQRRAGREVGSRSAVADSNQTLLCTYLSGVLLVGLVLNSQLGWTWADPVAALAIAAFALREGIEAWRCEACC
jgi:divalent metal cation (Fe/Co/Zn/Cd) transporter